jgi:hypothetical protein
LSEIANARQDDVASPFWIEAALEELAGTELDMKGELFIHFLVDAHTPEPGSK